ncbi:PAS domain S-box protein [Desulfospira joergensenii]|uniref:PAS domain S-box protein n=1 Tax=Desulfospira joergensenii TaxID=53329 RepID=UPI0003B494DB|nr:PAS domain S-box protein [Desulfospira joergensenii]
MNIFTKTLLSILPLVILFAFTAMGISYYLSRSALTDLGETWLDTRLSEAMDIVRAQEEAIQEYGLGEVPASIAKAKMDAAAEISGIGVGKKGYIFALDKKGMVVIHPSKYILDTDMSIESWFPELKKGPGRLLLDVGGEESLARFNYFPPWDWYILAVDPMQEVYGVSNRMKPILYTLGISGALMITLALMFLTRRLTRPLDELVQGIEKIGKGNLDTRIPVQSNDEFGRLAEGFNQMTRRLQESLKALKHSEEHFRALIENSNDMIWIVDSQACYTYVSPSTRRILGYSPEELMGRSAFELIHPDDREEVIERFHLRLRGKMGSKPTEQRFRHKDEYWSTIESIAQNLLDHPAIRGVVINSRDITKRKKVEEALKISHRALEKRVEGRDPETD